jgi:hypothetical protein
VENFVRVLIFSILITFGGVSPALAWHDAGTRAAASIAFDAMEPAEQNGVVAILKSHPRFEEDFTAHMPESVARSSGSERGRWLLEQAATWPDLIETLGDDVRREYNRSRWHYINMIIYLSDTDEALFDGKFEHNMETRFEPPLRQNLNIVQALRGNLAIWHDQSTPDAEKAVALCWILHLTGDLHQPLHNVALFSKPYFPTGDRGGNNIEVVWGDGTRNLHSVWDGLPTDMISLEPSARTLLTIETDTVDDAAIDEWLSHHANLARRFVYSPDVKEQLLRRLTNEEPPLIEVSHEYLVRARSIARRQVNLAGHRIARLLTASD